MFKHDKFISSVLLGCSCNKEKLILYLEIVRFINKIIRKKNVGKYIYNIYVVDGKNPIRKEYYKNYSEKF